MARPCKPASARPYAATRVAVRPAAILLAAIKGFVHLAGPWPVERTLDLGDAFQRRIAVPINNRGGLVHKPMGDGLMAVFGDKGTGADAAWRAGAAALDMRLTLTAGNAERLVSGEPTIAIGIGVHYAMVAIRREPSGGDPCWPIRSMPQADWSEHRVACTRISR
jgi:class 3 adenylate cyclase